MNLKIFAIVAALALSFSVVTMTNIAKPVMANDKCLAQHIKGEHQSGTLTCAFPNNKAATDAKKDCKETTDKKEIVCSSSQTGHHLIPNQP